ncbi:unnamed protein product [Echinostoma caproni]|uniref:Intraflagellar transport protein 46 homolog n=1 Tax=Echinostoma caproni TaxID=27848 RepID=A0A183ASI0_9TREM|nr:unnamed protein product [Echinostoma caproni]
MWKYPQEEIDIWSDFGNLTGLSRYLGADSVLDHVVFLSIDVSQASMCFEINKSTKITLSTPLKRNKSLSDPENEVKSFSFRRLLTNEIMRLSTQVPRPDGKPDNLGLLVLDEPCANQSDPTVLDLHLRALSKQSASKKMVSVFDQIALKKTAVYLIILL